MLVVGLDLAGVEIRPTGLCVLDTESMRVKTELVYSDDEILKKINEINPEVVAVDAPLSLPRERCCLKNNCSCRNKGHLRECDKMLLKMKIRFFPVTLGPMRKLTERGINLKKLLEKNSNKVIEVYPGGAQDILKIPRKQKGLNKLREGLKKLGIKGLNKRMNDHELDAVTSAYVGKCFVDGNYQALGDEREGLMIMPEFK